MFFLLFLWACQLLYLFMAIQIGKMETHKDCLTGYGNKIDRIQEKKHNKIGKINKIPSDLSKILIDPKVSYLSCLSCYVFSLVSCLSCSHILLSNPCVFPFFRFESP